MQKRCCILVCFSLSKFYSSPYPFFKTTSFTPIKSFDCFVTASMIEARQYGQVRQKNPCRIILIIKTKQNNMFAWFMAYTVEFRQWSLWCHVKSYNGALLTGVAVPRTEITRIELWFCGPWGDVRYNIVDKLYHNIYSYSQMFGLQCLFKAIVLVVRKISELHLTTTMVIPNTFFVTYSASQAIRSPFAVLLCLFWLGIRGFTLSL